MQKESCIKAVRGYLQNQGLAYCEYETMTGSIYFHVSTSDNSNPCIRISDHDIPRSKKNSVTLNIVYTKFSKRVKPTDVKNRVHRSLDNAFIKCQKYSLSCAFEQI
jgi:hypothetical protein